MLVRDILVLQESLSRIITISLPMGKVKVDPVLN
jgi:hypothetical protein